MPSVEDDYFLPLELIEFSTSSDSKLKKSTCVYLKSFCNDKKLAIKLQAIN